MDHRVYRTQAAAYSSLYFFIFLSLQFSNIKYFVTLFSETVKYRRLKPYTHVDNEWVDVSCIPKVFVTFFSRTAGDKKLKQYKHEE